MSFIKRNFVCKEKSGAVKKAKLVTKIKKHNQLYFGTVVLASCVIVEITHKARTSFKARTGFKESSKMALKKVE